MGISSFFGLVVSPKRCYNCLAVYDESCNSNLPCRRHNGSPVARSKTDNRQVWSCCQKPCFLSSAFGTTVTSSGCVRSAHQSDEEVLSLLLRDDQRTGVDVTHLLGSVVAKTTDQFTICEQTKSGLCADEQCGGRCLNSTTKPPPVDSER